MNTPTPETNKAERITKYTGEYMVPTEVARKLERERDDAREQRDELAESILNLSHPNCVMLIHERDEWKAYADKLAAGLPIGMLPADVENLREANGKLADSLYQAERELASALSDVNLYKTYIAEQGSSIIYRRASKH